MTDTLQPTAGEHIPFEPPAGEITILGHPRGLFILFLTEMWERFSYYGMRGLLVIYLTQHFLFSDEKSTVLYGAYTALVYVMTIIGGSLADHYLGSRKAVTFGAILLVLGHFGMAFEGSGSQELISYKGAEYQITLDGRGGDANQIIVNGDAVSKIEFSDDGSQMLIAEPGVVNLPSAINVSDFTTRTVTEKTFQNILYLSLALIIAGVGFLKANISTIVGALYGEGDPRRDSGFTIFYMGINLGSFLASILCGYLGIVHGWKYGFGLAGIGMLAGLLIFLRYQSWLEGRAEPPDPAKLKASWLGPINYEWMCYLIGLGIIAVAMFFVMNPDGFGKILGPVGIIMFALLVGYAFKYCEGDERQRMFAATYFVLAQIPFWALFEQAGSSLTLLTDRLVDRSMFGWSVPTPIFQSLNAGFIFLFAPIFAWMWIALSRSNQDPASKVKWIIGALVVGLAGLMVYAGINDYLLFTAMCTPFLLWMAFSWMKNNFNPSTPVKFSIGVFFAGLGFLALVAGMQSSGVDGMTAVGFIFLIYWVHTMGELMVSPVGLSAVTKMAPARVVGMTMGAWFLYSGLSNFLAGVIARTTGAETLGGQLTNVAAAKAGFIDVYTNVAYTAMGIAVFMLLISPIIKKWMHGAD